MRANGTHQIKSLVTLIQPNFQGSRPDVASWTNPIGPKIFPRNPTRTMGQCLAGSVAAIAYPIPYTPTIIPTHCQIDG